MIAAQNAEWLDANQRYLGLALARLRARLERSLADGGSQPGLDDLGSLIAEMPAPPALERIAALFGLSAFERELLLLCAAVELDANVTTLLARVGGDPARAFPSFSLALATLPGAHWSALAPDGPLRRWRLIEIGSGPTLTGSPLRIDERILHELAGVPCADPRLSGLVAPCPPPVELVPSHELLADHIARVLLASPGGAEDAPPVVHLNGVDPRALTDVAVAAAHRAGLGVQRVQPAVMVAPPADLAAFARVWERESLLDGSVLLLDVPDMPAADGLQPRHDWLVDQIATSIIVSSRERMTSSRRTVIPFDVPRPTRDEQRTLWRAAVPAVATLNGQLDQLVAQFDLGSAAIREAGAAARGEPVDEAESILWEAGRRQARPRLEGLAQRLDTVATWDDLVLPPAQRATLRAIGLHVRHRQMVYETWGFAGRGARGLGIGALFAGASGTGKTTAAEALAGELRLDLFRIDIASTVSKYIGETEKNLRRVFDAAEEGGAILLFDEADALFGKRTEIKDSHDRYANIEVSYLLQRIETYRGLAILTTNMRSALDQAFLRRIRFIVQFPFPDAAQRAEIWRRAFPTATPVTGLDYRRLAQLNIAGGNIRNIALGAAFLAAADATGVRMAHVLEAARSEYAKIEKPLTDAELEGWSGD